MNIAVVGLGFVGLSMSSVLASKNYNVVGIDIDKQKCSDIRNGLLPLFEPDLENTLRIGLIKEINPDLIVLCRCKRKIKSKILSLPKIGCTNIHYGLLPKYGGIGPIHWAIRNGEDKIGVTLQFMSEEFDEGDIIAQQVFSTKEPIRYLNLGKKTIKIEGITAWEAYTKANQLGLKIFEDNFEKLRNGNFERIKQDLTKKLYYTKDSIDYGKDRILDLRNKSDTEISNLIRAFTFPPCQIPATYKNDELIDLKIESK